MSTGDRQPTEEELRAAYEAELKRIRVEQVVLEQVVTLVNLGMRRTGIAPGTEEERDPEQVRIAVEGVRALMGLVEQLAPEQAGQIRDALSRLQLAYVQIGGQERDAAPAGADPSAAGPGGGSPGAPDPGAPDPGAPSEPPPPSPAQEPEQGTSGGPGPAQRSGRLWVPGQP